MSRYACIKTGGKQYRVKQGDVLDVELLGAEPDSTFEFKEVLMIRDPESNESKVGQPIVDGAVVKAKVMDTVKGEKVDVYKFKRRQNYHRKLGHRQKYSRVEILEIVS